MIVPPEIYKLVITSIIRDHFCYAHRGLEMISPSFSQFPEVILRHGLTVVTTSANRSFHCIHYSGTLDFFGGGGSSKTTAELTSSHLNDTFLEKGAT